MSTRFCLGISAIALMAVFIVKPAFAATNKTIGTLSTTSGFSDVAVSGNYAYLADGMNGITVANITSSSNPTLVRHIFVPDLPIRVAVDGTALYVNDNTVVQIMNLTDPANPTISSTITPVHGMSLVGEVASSGNNLYILVGSNTSLELQKYDVTNKSGPSFLSSLSLASGQTVHYGGRMVLSGSYAYVTSGHDMYIVNVADMTLGGTYTNSAATFLGVQVTGSVAYINGNGLHAVSVANVSAPVDLFDTIDNVVSGSGIAISHGYIFLTRTTGEVMIYLIGSSGTPVYVDTMAGSGYGSGLSVVNNIAYVANGSVLQLFDVLKPDVTAPTITLKGDNPMSLQLGQEFTDPGSTAVDTVDGDVTSKTTVSGSVNTKTVGQYALTYTNVDQTGNTATIKRTVYVMPTLTNLTLKKNTLTIKVGKKNVLLTPFRGYSGSVTAKKIFVDTTTNPEYFFVSTSTKTPEIVVYTSKGKLVRKVPLKTISTTGLRVQFTSNPLTSSVYIAVAPTNNAPKFSLLNLSRSGLKKVGSFTAYTSKGTFVMKFLKAYTAEYGFVTALAGKPSTIKIWRYDNKTSRFLRDVPFNIQLIRLSGSKLTLK